MSYAANVARALTSLTPSAAAGIAILCCVAAVVAAQLAARDWRAAETAAPAADDPGLVLVHARADGARARARAGAYQFSSSVLLAVTATLAIDAIAPGLPALGLASIALAGGIYLIVDAVLSARAELRRIADEESFNDFNVRSPGLARETIWTQFMQERPAAARRLARRRAGAGDEPGDE